MNNTRVVRAETSGEHLDVNESAGGTPMTRKSVDSVVQRGRRSQRPAHTMPGHTFPVRAAARGMLPSHDSRRALSVGRCSLQGVRLADPTGGADGHQSPSRLTPCGGMRMVTAYGGDGGGPAGS